MKNVILIVLLFLSNFFIKAQDNDLKLKDPNNLEWFKQARFGMFIHWGLYSVLEGSYKDRTMPDKSLPNGNSWYAEWIQARLNIPAEEYKLLVNQFDPVLFDVEKWVLEAKNAGMNYMVITAKHHDGFALWDSKISDYDIMQTPYKKDILAEFVKACKKHGMKYGFYYSHWQDWEYPGGALPNWCEKRSETDFEKYWQEKSLPQIKELLINYDPDLLWFDTWNEECHINPQRRDQLIGMIRKHSSKCLINGRISFFNPGDNIDYLEMNDNEYPKEMLSKPWQTPATMQNSWGFHAKDYNWKSTKEMLTYLIYNISKGGNYLLNIGPKADGTFPIMATRRLREMGAWLFANNESIYGTSPVNINLGDDVYLTQKKIGKEHYLYVFLTKPVSQIKLPFHESKATTVLETNRPLEGYMENGTFIVELPSDLFRDSSIQVLKIIL